MVDLPFIDIKSSHKFLEVVVRQYEKSAPTVSRWADDLYIRLHDDIRHVLLIELITAQSLLEENTWVHPHLAANRIYKLMEEPGQDTTGHAGY